MTLPQIAPVLAGAAALAFMLSFDEFLITFFVVGNDQTLPVYIFGRLRRTVDPGINVASTLLLAITMLLWVVAAVATLRAARNDGAPKRWEWTYERASRARAGWPVRGVAMRSCATVLRDVDLEIPAGEFVTFLGPRGAARPLCCGSSPASSSRRRGRSPSAVRTMTGVSPHRRPVNMVFQRPTLFPHLDVFENVAFGLRVDRHGKSTRSTNGSQWALNLVRMPGYERRSVE